jgi:hypothetical protein
MKRPRKLILLHPTHRVIFRNTVGSKFGIIYEGVRPSIIKSVRRGQGRTSAPEQATEALY